MSVAALVSSCILSLLLLGFLGDLGGASAERARAQTAADAAALAAVAEAAPYGAGYPGETARRFAQLNGAELVGCICRQGSTFALVAVEFAGVRARARAEIDPALLAPMTVTYDDRGLHPALARAVKQLLAAANGAVYVTSGYRSPERQADLWEAALAKYGSAEAADDWVAPPGRSQHERGLAVDLGGDLNRAVQLIWALDLPLYRPLANEPWHFELLGSRG